MAKYVIGTAQNDALNGDHLFVAGLEGDDYLSGGIGDNVLLGGRGDDYLDAGHFGSDTLYGGRGDDRLLAGGGEDLVKGGSGRDFLSGGEGNDRLFGGKGRDTFFFRADGIDTARDFDPSKDKIVVEAAPGTVASYDAIHGTLSLGSTVIAELPRGLTGVAIDFD